MGSEPGMMCASWEATWESRALLPSFPSGRFSLGMWLPLSTGEGPSVSPVGGSGLAALEGVLGWAWTLISALPPPSGLTPACSDFSTGKVSLLSKLGTTIIFKSSADNKC